MTPASVTWLAVGTALGMGAAIIGETDLPKRDDCQVYRVARKSAVSYVLRPPALEQAKCDAFAPTPIVEKPRVTETAENDTQPDLDKTDETQKPCHRRWRHRRRWR